MSEVIYNLKMEIDVWDEPALRRAAKARALEEGMTEEDARLYLDEEKTSIGQCLTMMIDPGRVAGCSIGGTEVDSASV